MAGWIYIIDREAETAEVIRNQGSSKPLTERLQQLDMTRGRFEASSELTPHYRRAELYKANGFRVGFVHRIGLEGTSH